MQYEMCYIVICSGSQCTYNYKQFYRLYVGRDSGHNFK